MNSSSKKSYFKSQINLPFPYPMIDLHKDNRWPFREEGFIIASGQLNVSEKLVIINDLATIVAFNKMGFFGVHSNREIVHKSVQNKEKPFTVGFYSLKPIELSSALEELPEDINKMNHDNKTPSKNSFNSMKLNLEEAYFLCYVFGLLKIAKNSDEYYNLDELWECFCQTLNNDDHSMFVARFAAYFYFRSRGYVVKNGFKFGVDYLLYEDGPPFNHSHYSVIVEHKIEGHDVRTLNYHEISGLTRISKNARKELIICTVIIPKPIADNLISSGPKCIKHFKIDTIQVSRKNLLRGNIDFDPN